MLRSPEEVQEHLHAREDFKGSLIKRRPGIGFLFSLDTMMVSFLNVFLDLQLIKGTDGVPANDLVKLRVDCPGMGNETCPVSYK